jgi:hypothetical protein
MRNRFFSPCSLGRLFDVPLRSCSLFSSCHISRNKSVEQEHPYLLLAIFTMVLPF